MESNSTLLFCRLCHRPYTEETSYNRHVAYCQRARNRPRTRLRSCRSCSSAKTKCDFQSPCRRCTAKGFECVYDKSKAANSDLGNNTTVVHEGSAPKPTSSSSSNEHLLDAGLPLDFALGSETLRICPDISDGLESGSSSLNSSSFLTVTRSLSHPSFVDLFPQREYRCESAVIWSCWTNRDDYLISQTSMDTSLSPSETTLLARMKMSDPVAQNNTTIILQALRSYPQMLMRRETFPPFIHPRWNEISASADTISSTSLSTCMSIVKSFYSIPLEARTGIWDIIRSEEQRFANELHRTSRDELLASIQSYCIYILIRFLDDSQKETNHAFKMLITIQTLCERFRKLCGEPFCTHESTHPGSNWEEWIFAENRRRMTIIWFLLDRIVSVSTGIPCGACQAFRDLPLPCTKSLWEARTYAAWESEYVAVYSNPGSRLENFGDLIDANEGVEDSSNLNFIDFWNAGIDNLGGLMNLALAMV